MITIIFSKDRALQLDALLRSMEFNCSDYHNQKIAVIYKYSSEVYDQAYNQLVERYSDKKNIKFIREINFKSQLINEISHEDFILFLVDDNIFIRKFNLEFLASQLNIHDDSLGLSLRLGRNTTYCYTKNQKQSLPNFEEVYTNKLYRISKYLWIDAENDFGYPLELSSSMYRVKDIIELIQQKEYSNPNTLETLLSNSTDLFQRTHPNLLCNELSLAFCLPLNMVQNEYLNNRVGENNNYSSSRLNQLYLSGYQIDVTQFKDFIPNSCHQEIDLKFEKDQNILSHQPKFTIIMANYNGSKYIEKAVQSVLNQTLKDWELIIVDDASTDDSVQIIQKFLDDQRIKLIQHDINKKYITALITGIKNVGAPYFGTLDSDDALSPNALEIMYKAHIEHSEAGYIYSQFMYCDKDLKPIKLGYCAPIPSGFSNLDSDKVSHFRTFKKSFYDKTLGYEIDILHAEDKDIAYKMEEVGDLVFVNEVLYYYRVLENSISHIKENRKLSLETMNLAKERAIYRRAELSKNKNLQAIEAFNNAQILFYEQKFEEAEKEIKKYKTLVDYHSFVRHDKRKNQNPQISIIIVTYNTKYDLLQCISSVINQENENTEIIVVDNGENEEVLSRLLELPILYIKNPINLILSEGRNIGAHFAKGKILAFLDDDAIADSNWIEKIKSSFSDTKIIGLRGKVLPKNKNAFIQTQNHYNLGESKQFIKFVDTEGNSSFLKYNYDSINGMNPLLFGGEGTELCYRLFNQNKNYNLLYNNELIIYHDYAVSEAKNFTKLKRYEVINNYLRWKYNDFFEFKKNQIISEYDQNKIKILYVALASPSYPQILEKINNQLLEYQKINPLNRGIVVGYGTLERNHYLFNYFGFVEEGRNEFLKYAYETIDKYAIQFEPDLIYFRYPASTEELQKFTSKHNNIIFEHQTKELEEYKTIQFKDIYNDELKYGSNVLKNVLGLCTITDEVGRYEQTRAGKKIDYHQFGNGIGINDIPQVSNLYSKDILDILFMGHFSKWHGFDRIIKGLSNYNGKKRIVVHVCGKGNEALEYIELIKKYNLEKNFKFYGFLDKEKINQISNMCQIAIGVLGLHRINFKQIAPLKHREYALRGLPFIYAGEDVDFDTKLDFTLKVPSDDSPIDFNDIVEFSSIREKNKNITSIARNYAINNLSWSKKISDIYDFLSRTHSKYSIELKSLKNPYPLISIIIPCYNQAEFLRDAVKSVIDQSYENWELIIVNDGSIDNTTEVANSLIKENRGKRITLIDQENGGLSNARNSGIRISKGKYFIPLDADDKLHPNFIKETLNKIIDNENLGFVYTDIQHFGDREDIYLQRNFNIQELLTKDNIVTVASLVRKQVWFDINGYNENMKEGYEDWDFWIGAVEKGWTGLRINKPLFYYRKRNSSMLANSNTKREKLIATLVINHQKLYDNQTISWANSIINKKINKEKITITFLINSILGITGGNQTLLFQANSLVKLGFDINIVTYSQKPSWINILANVILIPQGEPMHKYVPESDVVVSTYFLNTFELQNINSRLKIYYAQGDQFIFDQNRKKLNHNELKLYEKLMNLSKESYKMGGYLFIPNSLNLATAVESRYKKKFDDIIHVGIDETVYFPIIKNNSKPKILVVGPDTKGSEIESLEFKGISDIKNALILLKNNGIEFDTIRISNTKREIFNDFECEFYLAPNDLLKSKLFGKADILIYASHFDSSPLPPLEAMSAGIKVICTETKGALEYCIHNYNSILVPIKNHYKIAEAVTLLINNHELSSKIVKGGIETASKYTRENQLKKILEILKQHIPEIKYESRNIFPTYSELIMKFEAFIKLKEYSLALGFGSKIIQILSLRDNSNHQIEEVSSLLGNLSLTIGNIEQANKFFEKELQINPSSSRACFGLAETFYIAELYEQAKAMYEWAIKNGKNDEAAWNKLRLVNKQLNLDENNNSLDLVNIQELLQRAEEYINNDDFENALDLLDKILGTDENNIDALNDLSVIFILQNEIESALNVINKVIDLDSENEIAKNNLQVLENKIKASAVN